MAEPEIAGTLIEARCNGCTAKELEESLRGHEDEDAAHSAAEIFKGAHDKARQLLEENPGLLRRQNMLAQELGEFSPQAEGGDEIVFGNYSRGTVCRFAANCAVMQASGTCRILNPIAR
jgi:hypothetical protein